jgi:hypothetical protein
MTYISGHVQSILFVDWEWVKTIDDDDDKYIYFTVITKLHYINIGQILHVISNGHGVGY